MKKGEIVQRYNDLVAVKGLTGIQLLYAVKRNKDILKPIAEQLHQSVLIPPSDEFLKHEEELRKIILKPDNTLKEDKDIDYTKLDALLLTNKDVIAKRNADIKEYNAIMKTEYDEEVKTFHIPLSIAPSTQEEFDAISFMIADMTPEQEAKFNELFNNLT